jgi:hypothetical protein
VVLVLTGHTLKDADYTIDFHRGTLLKDEEKRRAWKRRSTACGAMRKCRRHAGRGAGRDEGQSGMSDALKSIPGPSSCAARHLRQSRAGI